MRLTSRQAAKIAPVAVVVMFAALLVFTSQARAQQAKAMNSSLAGQLRLFQLRVVSGRIQATSPISQQNLTSNYMGTQRRERLSIDLSGGMPTVSFERTAPEERISIEIDHGRKVTVDQVPKSSADDVTLHFVQPEAGAMTLTISHGAQTKIYHAPTLWHLLLIEPEVTGQHLVPLLQIMRPGWQLERQAQAIEEALCRVELAGNNVDRAAWERSVHALASDRYVERERAEQQLRTAGPVVLPFLRMQLAGRLDPEQAFRVRRIVRGLAGEVDEDTPDRVTPWLMGDPRVWYALLSRDSADVRRTAGRQLSRALAAEIAFDPLAAPADRERQILALAERFAEALAPPAPPAENDD